MTSSTIERSDDRAADARSARSTTRATPATSSRAPATIGQRTPLLDEPPALDWTVEDQLPLGLL